MRCEARKLSAIIISVVRSACQADQRSELVRLGEFGAARRSHIFSQQALTSNPEEDRGAISTVTVGRLNTGRLLEDRPYRGPVKRERGSRQDQRSRWV